MLPRNAERFSNSQMPFNQYFDVVNTLLKNRLRKFNPSCIHYNSHKTFIENKVWTYDPQYLNQTPDS